MSTRKKKVSNKRKRTTSRRPQQNPAWLYDDPQGASPNPPAITRPSLLPFSELSWEDFERLCLRISERDGPVEAAWGYGKTGHAQHGIDILVRMADATYEVWQSKRRKIFSASDLKAAVKLFLKHEWAAKAKRFVLAVASDFSSPKHVRAIEEARDQLKAKKIEFDPRDAHKLTERLRTEPELVDDYFGRHWVTAMCPPEALQRLENRLSRFDLASIRLQLRSCYSSWISTVDPGLPIAGQDSQGRTRPAIPITDRYVQPDILLQTDRADQDPEKFRDKRPDRADAIRQLAETGERMPLPSEGVTRGVRQTIRERRMPLDEYLASKTQSLIVGEAGSGKSSLLRFLALDILADEPTLSVTREQYKNFLPIWVPFALWTRMATDQGRPPAIEDVVTEFFRAQSETALALDMRRAVNSQKVIFLVDGLDESTDQTAAQTVIALLTAFVDRHNIPVVATSRPHGIRGLSGFGGNWARVELAPLSDNQRHALAMLWFRVLTEIEASAGPDRKQIEVRAKRKADNFMSALQRNPGITRLSQTPLFLLALVDLHRHGHDLPRSRFAASREIIEQLIEHQPKRRDASALSTGMTTGERRLRDRIIADFAYALQSGELRGSVPDAAIEEEALARAARLVIERQGNGDVEAAEASARSIFSFTEERAGLLVKKTRGNIGFLHLSLQEYLAARHLLQKSLSEKCEFIREHADEARWREPILYLLSLIENEHETSELLQAIEVAPAADVHTRALRDSLLTDAVFADFSHSLPVVRRLAERFFSETEINAWGARQRHLLSSVVAGLFSESLSGVCQSKLEEWIPDRHGYGRATAIRNMVGWDASLRPAAIPVLLRCLHSEVEHVWRPAAQVLPDISNASREVKDALLDLARQAPTVETMQAAMFSLGRGWSKDEDVGHIADTFRNSTHMGLCVDAIRIRAKRSVTDADDLRRFFFIEHGHERFSIGVFAPDLIAHFAKSHRAAFIELLETGIAKAKRDRVHDLVPLIGSLTICDPENPLINKHLLNLLDQDWVFHGLFAQSGFPVNRVKWTPDLIAKIEAYVKKSGEHQDYDLYWVSKVAALPSLKQRFIEGLKGHKYLSFWSARALAEGWGRDDPEVRDIFVSFLDATPERVSIVAEELPLVLDDKVACRTAIIGALKAPLNRYDFLIRGLKNLGTSPDDEEAVQAALHAAVGDKAPLYQDLWRDRIIETFPARPEVRAIALQELQRCNGSIGTVAASYAGDIDMCGRLLKTVCPLGNAARTLLMSDLQPAAQSNSAALEIITSSRDDTEGTVSSEATMGWVEAHLARGGLSAANVEYLASELNAVGPDGEEHRAAAVVGLTLTGNIGRFVSAKRYDGKPLDIRMNPRLRADDGYLRRVLPHWDDLRNALGSEEAIFDRLDLSAETTLAIVRPGVPNSERLFKLLMEKVPTTLHVHKVDVISAIARFAPQSEEMRAEITPLLLGSTGVGRTNADYWASLMASEIFAEYFSNDLLLRKLVVENFTAHPNNSAAAGALAELVLRQPDAELKLFLAKKCEGISYDIGTHFKLVAALSTPVDIVKEVENLLRRPIDAQGWSLSHWVPALLRRIKADPELQDALYVGLINEAPASIMVSFPALLGRACGTTDKLRLYATNELSRLEQVAIPVVGFDLTTYEHRPAIHVLTDLIS